MAWTTRIVLKKPGGDPLREFVTTYPHGSKNTLKDPRITGFSFWRNSDRSIALIFMSWDSKESWEAWQTDNRIENMDSKAEVRAWAESRGIDLSRQIPTVENQNWSAAEYVVDGNRGYDRVTIEQVMSGD